MFFEFASETFFADDEIFEGVFSAEMLAAVAWDASAGEATEGLPGFADVAFEWLGFFFLFLFESEEHVGVLLLWWFMWVVFW